VKAKRILAMMLSVAMILASVELPTKASELPDTVQTVSFVSEGDRVTVSGDLLADTSDVSGDETETTGVSAADVSGANVTDVSVNGAEAADLSGNSVSENGVSDGDTSAADTSARIMASSTSASSYFEVSDDGTLQYKDGYNESNLSGNSTLILDASVKKIPVGIFNNNTKIVNLTVPKDSALVEIEAGAFERSSVKSIYVPKTVKRIKEGTFKNSSLQAIEFDIKNSTLDGVDKEAFSGSAITSVTFPVATKTIGESAFKGCNSLTTVGLANVQIVGVEAFSGCGKLSGLTWSPYLEEVQDRAFSGCKLTQLTDWNTGDDSWLSGVVWGRNIFEKNTSLKTVKLSANMREIPEGMFYGCTALETVTFLKNSVCERIGRQAFAECTALKSIDIPASVDHIESEAFENCQKLATVTIRQQGSDGGDSTIVIAKDAFPQKAMTFKGYNGTVKTYAENWKEYEFTTLYADFTVKKSYNNSHGSVSLSASKAKKGDTIEVSVTPDSGYRIKAENFTYNDEEITNLKEIKEKSETASDGTVTKTYTYIFTFEMPDEDVTVYVTFESDSSGYEKKYFYPQISSIDGYSTAPTWDRAYNRTDWGTSKIGILSFQQAGQAAKMEIWNDNKTDKHMGSWLFTFSSSNNNVVVVGSDGTIYTRGSGNATITVKAKKNSTEYLKFKVVVEEDADPDEFTLSVSAGTSAQVDTEEINGQSYTVVTYTKSNLSKEAKSFEVDMTITSTSYAGRLMLPTTWKVNNTDIAYADKESANNDHNKITVKQGATGETAVTVTVTNGNSSSKDKVTYYEETFIIRVADTTPRLVQNKLTVNSQCTTGTEFNILPVYGYYVDVASLEVVQAVKNGSITKPETTEAAGYVDIKIDDETLFLELTKEGKDALAEKGKDLTYSNMYFSGIYITPEGEEEDFLTPIKSLVLTSKPLKPTVKLSGKLNLFFSSEAAKADKGEVTFTQSLKDLTVLDYELVSAANYESEGAEDTDSFANNFDVNPDGTIERSENAMILDAKGKPVTSGYLKITYAGYEPCYVKITVPTLNKKPAYVLSATKATVNTHGTGYEIKVQVLDKKTKQPISLSNLNKLSYDVSAKGTTSGLLENMDLDEASNTDTITMRVKTAMKGKAVVNVGLSTWNEPMKFTFNLNVNSKAPTVKAKSATLTLNNLCVGRAAFTPLIVNQDDADLINLNYTFAGKPAQAVPANKISFDYEDGVLSAAASQKIDKGSYKFTVTPTVRYADGTTENLKAFNVTVKVIDTKLTASLKPATVTLNDLYYGSETARINYTIKNLPAGDVELDTTDVNITGVNDAASAFKTRLDFSFDRDDTVIDVTELQKVGKAGSYKYRISGLKVKLDSGETAKVEDFTVTVKIISKEAKLNVKTSGSIIIGNSTSRIVYTLQPKNVNSGITDESQIIVTELDTTNNLNESSGELENFEIDGYKRDANGFITGVIIKADDSKILNAKTTYKLRIGFVLPGMVATQAILSKDLSIKPKQVLPKIKADITETTMYAGVEANSPFRSENVVVTTVTEGAAEIEEVVLCDKNSEVIKKAFAVSYDPETQISTVKLVQPAWVKANTTYSVKLEAKIKGQLDNTTGPTVILKVKILN